MFFSSLLFATSAVGTAAIAARRARQQKAVEQQTKSLTGTQQTVISEQLSEEEINHYFAASSLSLGLTMAGMFYYPLFWTSLPINIYTTIPTVRSALEAWSKEKRLNFDTFESTVVIGAMVTEHLFSASVIDWAYYFGRKLKHQLRSDFRTAIQNASQLQSRNVWVAVDDSEMQLPLNSVEDGDILILRENDIIPFAGRVTKGEASLNTYVMTLNAEPVQVESGDSVPPFSYVIAGQIHLQVSKA
jgi:cation transport ATPase